MRRGVTQLQWLIVALVIFMLLLAVGFGSYDTTVRSVITQLEGLVGSANDTVSDPGSVPSPETPEQQGSPLMQDPQPRPVAAAGASTRVTG